MYHVGTLSMSDKNTKKHEGSARKKLEQEKSRDDKHVGQQQA